MLVGLDGRQNLAEPNGYPKKVGLDGRRNLAAPNDYPKKVVLDAAGRRWTLMGVLRGGILMVFLVLRHDRYSENQQSCERKVSGLHRSPPDDRLGSRSAFFEVCFRWSSTTSEFLHTAVAPGT
jgi:hypothetical protein